MRGLLDLSLGVALACAGCGNPTDPGGEGDPADSTVSLNGNLAGLQVFPEDNWWNVPVDAAPVDPASDALIDWLCDRDGPTDPCGARAHPDFGPSPYGIPYLMVGTEQPLRPACGKPARAPCST